MSIDRHATFTPDPNDPRQLCRHCGKPMLRWWIYKYGSNACRQAAYRARLAKFLPPPDQKPRPGRFGHKTARRKRQHTPPSAEKTTAQNRQQYRGRPSRGEKGGAA